MTVLAEGTGYSTGPLLVSGASPQGEIYGCYALLGEGERPRLEEEGLQLTATEGVLRIWRHGGVQGVEKDYRDRHLFLAARAIHKEQALGWLGRNDPLFILGCMLIGLGVGMFFDKAAAGVVVGLGVGYLVEAWSRRKKSQS